MRIQEMLKAVSNAVVNHYGSLDNTPELLVARVIYAGFDDSGGVEEISILLGTEKMDPVKEKEILSLKVGESWELEQALESILDESLDILGLAGYENNEGGRGVMWVSLKYGMVLSVEHESYYTQSHTTKYGDFNPYSLASQMELDKTKALGDVNNYGVGKL